MTAAGSSPIYCSVEGAPYQPGETVVVTSVCDDVGRECGYGKYVGQRGTVVYLEYSCGCGQHFPDDPSVGVRMPDGEVVELWKDELGREGAHA